VVGKVTTVYSFDPNQGQFLEGLAIDKHGNEALASAAGQLLNVHLIREPVVGAARNRERAEAAETRRTGVTDRRSAHVPFVERLDH
jgi:hypothetical protein